MQHKLVFQPFLSYSKPLRLTIKIKKIRQQQIPVLNSKIYSYQFDQEILEILKILFFCYYNGSKANPNKKQPSRIRLSLNLSFLPQPCCPGREKLGGLQAGNPSEEPPWRTQLWLILVILNRSPATGKYHIFVFCVFLSLCMFVTRIAKLFVTTICWVWECEGVFAN